MPTNKLSKPTDPKATGRKKLALKRLPAAQQARLSALMTRNNDGLLTREEKREFNHLVAAAEALTVENAKLLAERRGG